MDRFEKGWVVNSLQAELREVDKKLSSARSRAKLHPNFMDGFDYMIRHYSSIKTLLQQHIETLSDAEKAP